MTDNNNEIVTQLFRRIAYDPVTNKLLNAICSFFLFSVAFTVWPRFLRVPFLFVIIISFIYSIFCILVFVFKKQDVIANSGILKKFFCGRNIYWFEIQTTMSIILASSNLFAIPLVCATYEKSSLLIWSILNVAFFMFEWYLSSKKAMEQQSFVHEEIPQKKSKNIILGFCGWIQNGLLVAAIYLIAINGNFEDKGIALYSVLGISVIATILFNLLEICSKFRKCLSKKLIPEYKVSTYAQLIVATYSFLSTLTYSFIHTIHHNYPEPGYTGYTNSIPGFYYTPMPPWLSEEKRIAILDVSLPFIFIFMSFGFSLLILYFRAIQSTFRSRANDSTEPLQIYGGVNSVDDLPMFIALPYNTLGNSNNKENKY